MTAPTPAASSPTPQAGETAPFDELGFQHGSPYALALDVLALQEDLLAHPALRLPTAEFESARRALLADGLIDATPAARLTLLGRRVCNAARRADAAASPARREVA